jgi:putative aldouronate transport system substrate-binding protein
MESRLYRILNGAMTLTSEEASKMAAIMNQVNTYTDEMYNKFIMGQAPLDQFDKYISNLKSMGIEDAIKIKQASYERFEARK